MFSMDGSTQPADEGCASATDTRHALTDEERQWCIALRAELKAQGVAEPFPQSDFKLAQFA
jgi:hypothetical protein